MTALVIANTQIRQDAAGRFCLNDLHQASGSEGRHRPGRWLDTDKARELISVVEAEGATTAGIPAVETVEGFGGGTYALKELVYAYAMWISAAFHLHVIRAYDAMVNEPQHESPFLLPQPQHRADQLVSAGRIFSAALRTARQLRMPPQKAMRAAFDCARRHTGIDWADELGPDALASVPTAQSAPVDPWREEVLTKLDTRSEFQMGEFIASTGLGNPTDTALAKRIAAVARDVGFLPHRTRDADRKFITLWRQRIRP